jgi:hypothetical protein
MEKLIRIKIYFASGKSVEYHTKEYSDANNEFCFWQGKTEITVNHKSIAVLEIEDVESQIESMKDVEKELQKDLGHNSAFYKSDAKNEYEPGYVYYICPREGCVNSYEPYRIINPISKNLSYDELRKRKADLIFKKCPICRTYFTLLYI